MNLKRISALANDLIVRSQKAAPAAAARYAQEGALLVHPQVEDAISQIAARRPQKNTKRFWQLSRRARRKCIGETVAISFTPDQLQFDFQAQKSAWLIFLMRRIF